MKLEMEKDCGYSLNNSDEWLEACSQAFSCKYSVFQM